MKITLKSIGIIHSSYLSRGEESIQGAFEPKGEGTIEVFPEYEPGLKDIEGFSHIIVLYHFHKAKDYSLQAKPYLSDEVHGIFAIRGPRRPNPIGFSIMKLLERRGNILRVGEVDALDGTPVLDIKPYIPRFDCRPEARAGWLEKS